MDMTFDVRDRDSKQRVERLTPREREVFEDLVVGHSHRVIAANLNISPRTVEVHRARIMKKTQAQSLPHLVRMAFEIGNRTEQGNSIVIQAAPRIERLTPREREVFEDIVVGLSNKEISHKLNISHRTVEVHRAGVMRKMQAQNLPHLVRMALEISKRTEQGNSMRALALLDRDDPTGSALRR
jgi:FixJ family two-component response regulator